MTLLALELKGSETLRKKAESALRKKEKELLRLRESTKSLVNMAWSLAKTLRGQEDLRSGLAWLSAKDKLEQFAKDHPEIETINGP